MDDPVQGQQQPERFCSYAVTGSNDAFQAIFVCRTCRSSSSVSPDSSNRGNGEPTQSLLRCICQACAEYCHAEHDVEYIGMGPCYCDCRELGHSCPLLAQSRAEAERLGLAKNDCGNNTDSALRDTASFGFSTYIGPDDSSKRPGYVRDVYRLSLLRDKQYTHQLQWQALELIRHSRETFWLGADVLQIGHDDYDGERIQHLCGLEQLACIIFRQHWQHYNLSRHCSDNGSSSTARLGAEWWVQVKSVSSPGDDENKDEERIIPVAGGGAAEAVDLHYDKDEALAEAFGLGAFPTVSTVTYLTVPTTTAAAPTVVFSHRYDESESHGISEMMVNHPAPHKHLVFDGRLLHGAPAHFALRRERTELLSPTILSSRIADDDDDNNNSQSLRITFLVNIWLNHKPGAVGTLPDTIRKALNACGSNDACTSVLSRTTSSPLFTGPLPVPTMTIDAATAGLDTDRIELPFVGGKATWGNGDDDSDDDEEEDAFMVLSTHPPPLRLALDREDDSLLVQFGPGFEAVLQNPEYY